MVESRKAKIGYGLFSKASFKKEDVIVIVTGKIISNSDEVNSNYIDIGEEDVLYPNLPYRHINHSCDPNCIFTFEENEDGQKTLYLEALRDIAPGQEIFTDYAWEPEFSIPCRCESDNCRGWIIDPEQLSQIGR